MHRRPRVGLPYLEGGGGGGGGGWAGPPRLWEVLDDVAAGRRERYPLYGALLLTRDRELDDALWEYLLADQRRVNAMLGDACMLFLVEDGSRIASPTVTLGFGTADVYEVADRLGALPEDVPCFAFFADPRRRSDVLVVQLAWMLPDGRMGAEDMQRTFVAVTSAVKAAATAPAARRLGALEHELRDRAASSDADVKGQRIKLTEATAKTVFNVLTGAVDLYQKVRGVS